MELTKVIAVIIDDNTPEPYLRECIDADGEQHLKPDRKTTSIGYHGLVNLSDLD